jgi:hypothetical protein
MKVRDNFTKFALNVCIIGMGSLASVTTFAAEKNHGQVYSDYKPYNFMDFLSRTHVDGNIRSYFFDRLFTKPGLHDQPAFSLGGMINVETASFFNGFGLGATLYTAQGLGINHSDDSGEVDRTLPGKSVTVLGQAYVQYQHPMMLLRFGDQLITTPWVNPADSRMIPATYQGTYFSLHPSELSDWSLQAMRLVRFKGRPKDAFSRTNLYNDSDNLGSPINRLLGTHDHGTLAGALSYKNGDLLAQLWGYRFYDYADLIYANVNYMLPKGVLYFDIQPILGIQYADQSPTGDDLIGSINSGEIETNAFGILAGAKVHDFQMTVAYNYISTRADGFKNGDIISPYTTNYSSDPLYTTSMIAGLIEKAAGHAYKISALYNLYNEHLKLAASYAKYYTDPFTPNTEETNFDVTYLPPQLKKNLSLRYRFGMLEDNPAYGRFDYHRVMVEYRVG